MIGISSWSPAGAVVGLALASGLLLLASFAQSLRPPGTLERIGPFLGLSARRSPASVVLEQVLRPRRRERHTVGLRLARSGFAGSIGEYRLEQAMWSASGVGVGALIAMVLAGPRPVGVLALGSLGGLLGVLARDWWLARRARVRRERVEAQLPAIAELLAFAVSAGDTPFAALTRAVATTDGELAREVQLAVTDMQMGRSLEAALRGLADRVGSADVDRFVDGLVLAIERGTPVAETLRAQAADARASSRQRLMEVAGRKDVLMLMPVVFLVLPTVIAVALLPGLQGMRVIAP